MNFNKYYNVIHGEKENNYVFHDQLRMMKIG